MGLNRSGPSSRFFCAGLFVYWAMPTCEAVYWAMPTQVFLSFWRGDMKKNPNLVPRKYLPRALKKIFQKGRGGRCHRDSLPRLNYLYFCEFDAMASDRLNRDPCLCSLVRTPMQQAPFLLYNQKKEHFLSRYRVFTTHKNNTCTSHLIYTCKF